MLFGIAAAGVVCAGERVNEEEATQAAILNEVKALRKEVTELRRRAYTGRVPRIDYTNFNFANPKCIPEDNLPPQPESLEPDDDLEADPRFQDAPDAWQGE